MTFIGPPRRKRKLAGRIAPDLQVHGATPAQPAPLQASFRLAMLRHTSPVLLELHITPGIFRIFLGSGTALADGCCPCGADMIVAVRVKTWGAKWGNGAVGAVWRLESGSTGRNARLGERRGCNERSKGHADDEQLHDMSPWLMISTALMLHAAQ
jgi:hypothetical protein